MRNYINKCKMLEIHISNDLCFSFRYLYCKEGHAEEEVPEDNLYFGEDIDPQEELS